MARRQTFSLLRFYLTVVLVTSLTHPVCSTITYDYVNKNFTASPMQYVDNNGLFLKSVNSTFALAFSRSTVFINLFYLSIIHVQTLVIVWSANRNSPIAATDQMDFRGSDGNVVLITGGAVVWATDTKTLGGTILQLQESGNLVLLTRLGRGKVLWQSFDHPTDTILSGQVLPSGVRLVSSISASNTSEGLYSLEMRAGEGLVLSADFPPQLQPYWTMAGDFRTVEENVGLPSYALISNGALGLYAKGSTSPLSEIALGQSVSPLRRATLGSDGNLQFYFFSGGQWNQEFQAIQSSCYLPSFCGPYGICTSGEQCNCPQSFEPVNSTDVAAGCMPPSTLPSCPTTRSPGLQFLSVGPSVTYFANQYSTPLKMKLAACQDLCLKNCSCAALFYQNETGSCYLSETLEGSLLIDGTPTHLAFLKVFQNNSLVGAAPEFTGVMGKQGSRSSPPSVLGIAIAVGAAALIALGGGSYYWCRRRRGSHASLELLEEDMFLGSIPGLPTRFSFKELQVATNQFSKKLGGGGFGSVYEGMLPDKSRIAVKQLESIGQGQKEFRAEVATIGSIHHVHLVQLRGFCAEGDHRLLVYELVANGSLEKVLFKNKEDGVVLDWETRRNIALGTARGIAYLHEDCRERIIHCDIKPENILLDENYLPKVADFGLAKLMNRDQSQVFTTLRGTRGYLAPEWLMNFAISEKSDVYSFGMVLLEIISGRKNFDPMETSEKWYFPAYAYQQAEVGKVGGLVDLKLKGSANEEQVSLALRVAFWCIQEEVAIRPSMSKVVNMLEGNVEVPNPPSSAQFVMRSHGKMIDSETSAGQSVISYNSGDLLSASRLSGPR